MNMFINLLFSLAMGIAGVLILINKKFTWKGMPLDMSENYVYVIIGGGLLAFSFLWMYTILKKQPKK